MSDTTENTTGDGAVENRAETWRLIATMGGYNELARKAENLGEKVYFRLARDAMRDLLEEQGVKITFDDVGKEVLELSEGPIRIIFHERDIELMRAAVAAYDKAHT